MALFIAPIIEKKDGKTVQSFATAVNYLLSNQKVDVDWKNPSSPTQTYFHYQSVEGQKYGSIRLLTTLTDSQLRVKLRKVTNEQFIRLAFVEYNGRQSYTYPLLKRININRIVYGHDHSINGISGYSVLYIERGTNKSNIKTITGHTIAEIMASSSNSGSLSK
jgi:hypothetical protein